MGVGRQGQVAALKEVFFFNLVAAFMKCKPRIGLFLEPQAKNGIISENCCISREK